jgi:hypothetical protein
MVLLLYAAIIIVIVLLLHVMIGSFHLLKVTLGNPALIIMIMIAMVVKIVQIQVVKECKIQIQELFAVKAIQIARSTIQPII